MSGSILKRLLKRYTSGTANSAERFLVDRWYHSFAEQGSTTPGLETEAQELETKNRMFSKIRTHDNITVKLWYKRPFVHIAASLVLVSIFAWLMYPQQQTAELKATIYQTAKAEIKKITLADRTEIWLNGNSQLTVLTGYAGKFRKVKLTGEAYFQVKHNPESPFIIASDGIETQVLGTSFNVSAYPKLKTIEVAVNTGKVSVSKSGLLLGSLTPGQGIQYDKLSQQAKRINVNTNTLLNWRNGQVMLENVSFDELAEKFSNMFNINLYTSGKTVKQLRFRLMINRKLSMKENLKIITGIHHLKYQETNEHEIEIYK
jgi:transmembrane sensor